MAQHPAREPLELSLMGLMDAASQAPPAWHNDDLQTYALHVQVLRALGQQERLRGLTYVCTLLERGLNQRLASGQMPTEDEAQLLCMWPAWVLSELLPPESSAQPSAWSLLSCLREIPWFDPLDADAVAYVESRLAEDAAALVGEPNMASSSEPEEVAVAHEAVLPLPEIAAPEPFQPEILESLTSETALPLAVAQVATEELGMVIDALTEFHTDTVPQLMAAQAEGDVVNALQSYEEHIANLLNAATHLGLTGFEKVLQSILVNTALLQITPEQATPHVRQCLQQAVELCMAYVQAPTVLQPAQNLALHMADSCWLHSTEMQLVQSWPAELNAIEIVTQRASESEHHDATAQDVDLSIPSDIESNVLNSLLDELPQHAQNFSQAIQRLQHGGNLDDLEDARRIAHTLKGAGNTAGIKGIGNLTHMIEEVLLAFGRVNQLPSAPVQASLMEAADCLEEMSESLTSGGSAPKEAVAVYQQMIDWVKTIEADGIDALPEKTAFVHATDLDSIDDAAEQGAAIATLPDLRAAAANEVANQAASEEEAYLRVPVKLIETLLKLVDEDTILAAQMQERVMRLNAELAAQRASSRQFRQLSSELEQLVDVRGLAMMGGSSHGLDSLEMDQYNELHILTRKIVEAGADGREFVQSIDGDINGLRDLIADKERVLSKMQSGIQRTRMVPVSSIVPRLQRAVRQAARVLDRSVQLLVQGEATLVDTQLLNAVLDSLMHLLRNAVDHGIEPAHERTAAGKPPVGTVVLSFESIGSNLAITCADDGRGFDLNGIFSKAVRMGLVSAETALSQDQIMRLILRPGFSTREEATHISGRGLGMSIVHKAVLDLRGTLEIRSPESTGSVFDMRFPVQLSAKQVMMSRSSQRRIALSDHGLEQLLPADPQLMTQSESGLTYLLGEEQLPVRRLDAMLGLPINALRDSGEQEIVIVVLNDQRERTAVIGPELSELRRVIVKPLGQYIPSALGVEGLSILGDGTVTAVLDLPDLLRAYEAEGQPTVGLGLAAPTAALPICLVVDDSVSVRRTMEQLMQDAGYQVITARDGLDALTLMERHNPDVALVDLEMPRMNGLDLTKSMRNRPQTKTTPVVMISSRFTDRHRALAKEAGVNEFLTKPYTEEILLGVVDALLRTQTKRNTE